MTLDESFKLCGKCSAIDYDKDGVWNVCLYGEHRKRVMVKGETLKEAIYNALGEYQDLT